ncbi:MAG: ribonuclease J [Lachnospiraceae bacterium]|nr:ribonuclease J [Lachnospiraceae bacterium]
MNITAFEYAGSIIVVDCGLAFPSEDMPGVDLVVPDVTYLVRNRERVRGFFITHGHEDHIGALPYILPQLNVPVYATRLTMAIIDEKLAEHGLTDSTERHIVSYGDVVEAGDFKVEFIRTNHSIADAASLAITSPAGVIIHTGDFKVDYTPVFGAHIDLQRLGELGKAGVLALLSDSTNAIRPGFTPSERFVAETFNSSFSEFSDRRILVATFASNVDRVQQIINSAVKYGRKVAIEGRSMVNVVGLAREMEYLKIPDNVLIDMEELDQYPDSGTVIIMTGSQGEAMAALSRVASDQHRKIHIGKNDVVIFSSSPIPGNEKAVARVMNELSMRGARIINTATHVSGHACREELKLIYALTKPKYAIPLHGEFRHREANAEIALEMQIPKGNVFLLNSGDVLTLSATQGQVNDTVPHGGVMVDGLGIGDVGSVVLRDRQNLSQDGIIVVSLTIDKNSGAVLAGPDIVSRGFVYVREAEALLNESKNIAADAVQEALEDGRVDYVRIRTEVRERLGSFLWREMKRHPVILPVIMEVEV